MLYQWNIIGHEKELSHLEHDVQHQALHHAYLFVGPEKIGKSRVAKTLANILQCPNNFCHQCSTCTLIEKKSHPDTIEMEDNGESIKISEIRDLISRLNMTSQSLHKILLIENMGRLTPEATNALLKILEEPPPQTVFLFTAHHIKEVMPTIASRMRIIHFKKLPDEVLEDALRAQHPEIDETLLDKVILLSLGRSGKALQLINEPEKLKELSDLYTRIQFLDEQASLATRMLAAQEISADPRRLEIFLSLLTVYLRARLLRETASAKREKIISIIETVARIKYLMESNVNPRLALEHLMLRI